MRFKYNEYLKKLTDYPPSSYTSQTLKSYRFVFASANHPHNFLPVLLINPQRKIKDPNDQCKGYGLSLYNDLSHALKSYANLRDYHPNVALSLGTHLAEGLIVTSDGVVSPVNNQGHFTLHEFEEVDLANKFSVIKEISDVKSD